MSKTTTIQISQDLKNELVKRKPHKRASYEDVIWDLIEDELELTQIEHQPRLSGRID